MNDASLLHIGAESDSNFVKIATKDGARPHRGSVADGDLSSEHHVGSHVGVNGHFGEPLT